ncbi:hypothetical protein EVA_21070, partial [gut metagenome]
FVRLVHLTEPILHLGIVGTDTFRPVTECIILSSPGIGQAEQIVLIPANR